MYGCVGHWGFGYGSRGKNNPGRGKNKLGRGKNNPVLNFKKSIQTKCKLCY